MQALFILAGKNFIPLASDSGVYGNTHQTPAIGNSQPEIRQNGSTIETTIQKPIIQKYTSISSLKA
jgi:hypothetical protein